MRGARNTVVATDIRNALNKISIDFVCCIFRGRRVLYSIRRRCRCRMLFLLKHVYCYIIYEQFL